MLPPDNFQEDPKPVVAHRTSPTNIGLYLLSAVAARDFGWAGTLETVERLEATLASMQKLAALQGALLQLVRHARPAPLDPAYVSSVDSGNLAGHLIALANACEEWMRPAPLAPMPRAGHDGRISGWRAKLSPPCRRCERVRAGTSSAPLLDEIEARLNGAEAIETAAADAQAACRKGGAGRARASCPAHGRGPTTHRTSLFWIGASKRIGARTWPRSAPDWPTPPPPARSGLQALADDGARDGAGDGFRVPARSRAQAAFDRLFAGRQRGSTPAATTCSPPKRGSPACSPSPRATSPTQPLVPPRPHG